MSDASTSPEQVVRDGVAWANGDDSKINVMSESIDVYNSGLPNGEVHDRDDWDKYHRKIHRRFPDVHFSIEEMVASDNVVMVEWKITGTHKGEFKGLPPTGREVEIWGIDKHVVTDGKIEEWHTYYDTGDLVNQLGPSFPDVIGQLPKLVWGKLQASV